MVAGDGQLKCSYCRQGHPSSSCTTITDLGQRKTILKGTGRCFMCLKRYHLSHDCHSPIRCAHCKGRHHTRICKEGHTNFQSTRRDVHTNQQPPSQQNQELSPSHNHEPPSSQSHTSICIVSTLHCQYCFKQLRPSYAHKSGDPSYGMTIRVMLNRGVRDPGLCNTEGKRDSRAGTGRC